MTNVDKHWCRRCGRITYAPINYNGDIPVEASFYRNIAASRSMSNGKTNFVCYEHQGKAGKFLDALNHGGKYHLVDFERNCNGILFVLSDTDIMGRKEKLDYMRRSGVKNFFIYPHAARPDLVNDVYTEWAHVTAHFVVSKGHADIMKLYGYSRPLMTVGWSLCQVKPFKARKELKNVLFAPIHPRCSKVDQDVNWASFKRLEKLAKAGHIKLTVRFINNLVDSGLERIEHPNILWTPGAMNQAVDQIDEADLVVGHQTFLYLAVARGVPAIGMAEDLPTHVQAKNQAVQWVKNWKKYEHLLAFPYDILQTQDLLSLMQKAVSCDDEIKDWRKRMIGRPFRKSEFLEKLEKFL
jgi:hypothetical protein